MSGRGEPRRVTLRLRPMTVPNFVLAETPPRSREEGLREEPKFALADLDADVLSGLCDDFRAEVFRKAGKPDPRTLPDPEPPV